MAPGDLVTLQVGTTSDSAMQVYDFDQEIVGDQSTTLVKDGLGVMNFNAADADGNADFYGVITLANGTMNVQAIRALGNGNIIGTTSGTKLIFSETGTFGIRIRKVERAILERTVESCVTEFGEIHFKTDNLPLFDWSVESFENNGWTLSELTRDLPANGPVGVMTDYEAKFYAEGVKINRLVARKERT